MADLLMLDTDTASYLIRGNSPVLDSFIRAQDIWQVCISAVTRAELRFGAARKSANKKLTADVDYFLNMMQTMPWNDRAADAYGEVRNALEKAGTPIGAFDTLIASPAKSLDATLVTNNTKHFKFVKGLKLANWAG